MFNGLGMNMGNLSTLSNAKSRSISPENFTGEKNSGGMATEGNGTFCARDLGQGWKMSPCITKKPGEIRELANIDGPGAIQQIWMTPGGNLRWTILRIYWDDQEQPSVECPVGDFFASAFTPHAYFSSLAVCTNPTYGYNCYWEMPFKKKCKITMENISENNFDVYYQINYTLTEVPEDKAYFHAQFRRTNPLPYKENYTILDGVKGNGHYVGTYLAWQTNNNGWWGEGEIKFYMDGDTWPTICGTGAEDYIGGSGAFEVNGQYKEFYTPYSGFHQVIRPNGTYISQEKFGMYRWHILDPIRFEADLRVTIQALGWRDNRRLLPLQDDIASVAFWYQTLPTAPFPKLPSKDYLEII